MLESDTTLRSLSSVLIRSNLIMARYSTYASVIKITATAAYANTVVALALFSKWAVCSTFAFMMRIVSSCNKGGFGVLCSVPIVNLKCYFFHTLTNQTVLTWSLSSVTVRCTNAARKIFQCGGISGHYGVLSKLWREAAVTVAILYLKRSALRGVRTAGKPAGTFFALRAIQGVVDCEEQ